MWQFNNIFNITAHSANMPPWNCVCMDTEACVSPKVQLFPSTY